MKCNNCLLWSEMYGWDVRCGHCPEGPYRNTFNTYVKDMVRCNEMWVPKARVDELERRTILPYNAPDGGYYVGRKGENGKIQEREPDYRP